MKTRKTESKRLDPMSVGHHLGARYGYDVTPDGRIELAPCVHARIDRIRERDTGLRAYIDVLNKFIVKQFEQIEADKKQWFDDLYLELPFLDREKTDVSYSDGAITLSPIPPKPAPEKSL